MSKKEERRKENNFGSDDVLPLTGKIKLILMEKKMTLVLDWISEGIGLTYQLSCIYKT